MTTPRQSVGCEELPPGIEYIGVYRANRLGDSILEPALEVRVKLTNPDGYSADDLIAIAAALRTAVAKARGSAGQTRGMG